MKRTTAALGVGVEIIEPDHLLNHLVTSFVAHVEWAASVSSVAGIAVGNPDVVRLPASSRSKGQKTGRKSRAFLGSGVKGARPDGGRMIDALFFNRITFSFFFKQQQYIVLVTPSLWWHILCGVLCWQWNERGGGGYFVQITNPPRRATHRWENRPTRPADRRAS